MGDNRLDKQEFIRPFIRIFRSRCEHGKVPATRLSDPFLNKLRAKATEQEAKNQLAAA